MLRISRRKDCLIVEGRVAGPWVVELRKAAENGGNAHALDLSGVSYVDAEGALLLRSLVGRGLAIRKSSAFITEMLKGATS